MKQSSHFFPDCTGFAGNQVTQAKSWVPVDHLLPFFSIRQLLRCLHLGRIPLTYE
jgi:hypothetical protein